MDKTNKKSVSNYRWSEVLVQDIWIAHPFCKFDDIIFWFLADVTWGEKRIATVQLLAAAQISRAFQEEESWWCSTRLR